MRSDDLFHAEVFPCGTRFCLYTPSKGCFWLEHQYQGYAERQGHREIFGLFLHSQQARGRLRMLCKELAVLTLSLSAALRLVAEKSPAASDSPGRDLFVLPIAIVPSPEGLAFSFQVVLSGLRGAALHSRHRCSDGFQNPLYIAPKLRTLFQRLYQTHKSLYRNAFDPNIKAEVYPSFCHADKLPPFRNSYRT